MKLNREKIIKALECCAEQEYCVTCPCDNECLGMEFLMIKALALIKELTEENEKLREVEVLEAELSRYTENVKQMCEQAKADTVRKMQERINAHFDSDNDYFRSSHGYIRSVVDQIAKEMLEG